MIGENLTEESNIRVGYTIVFIAAIGFVCSLTYNYGYFLLFQAGIRVLSIGDILTSYTLWVPSLLTLLFGYALDLFLRHIEQRDLAIKSKKQRKFFKRLLTIPHIIFLITSIAIVITYILFGWIYRPMLLWFGCCYIWLSVASNMYKLKIFAGRINRFILSIFIFVPLILGLMFTMGIDKALSDSKLHTANTNIYFVDNIRDPQPAILLRHLEKGLLTKQVAQNNYVLFTWDDLSKVEIIASGKHYRGIACDWFNLNCDENI